MKITTTFSLSFLLGASYLPAAMAQTVNGTLGSPSATTTIQGNQNSSCAAEVWWRDQGNREGL